MMPSEPSTVQNVGHSTRMGKIWSHLHVIGISARVQISDSWSSGAIIVTTLIQPVALLLILLNRTSIDPESTTAVVVGVVLTSFWSATIWGASSVLRRDRQLGTLSRTLLGTEDPLFILLGRTLGASLGSIVAILIATSATILLTQRSLVALPHPAALLIGLLGTVASGISVALILSPIFVVSRHALHITSALMYPVMILGGLLIPTTVLPEIIRWVPLTLNLYWWKVFFASVLGNGTIDWGAALLALTLTLLYCVVGGLLFRRLLMSAVRRGDMDIA